MLALFCFVIFRFVPYGNHLDSQNSPRMGGSTSPGRKRVDICLNEPASQEQERYGLTKKRPQTKIPQRDEGAVGNAIHRRISRM